MAKIIGVRVVALFDDGTEEVAADTSADRGAVIDLTLKQEVVNAPFYAEDAYDPMRKVYSGRRSVSLTAAWEQPEAPPKQP